VTYLHDNERVVPFQTIITNIPDTYIFSTLST